MLTASLKKNDKKAKIYIGVFSVVVFTAVVLLSNFKLDVNLGFDVHIFAAVNAFLNAVTAVLLLAALWAVKSGKFQLHKKIMITALILSVIFLVSYIAHHLLAGETKFGDSDHNGVLSTEELAAVGKARIFYFIVLFTHIFLAAIILPFILFTAYRGLTAEFIKHKKVARITWPLWLYVAITGPIIYFMISPYYN